MNKLLDFLVNNLYATFFVLAMGFVWWQIVRRNKQEAFAKKLLAKAIKESSHEPLTMHPEVDVTKCGGCAACTRVCPEGDILKMIDNKAVLVSPTKCVGHGECERACPFDAISLVFGTKTRGMDIPRVNKNYETNVPGLYIAGELGGMGLIRNAIKQGALAATHALENIKEGGKSEGQKWDYDLLVVGAGPAGLAASLAAIAQRKKYIIIEQNGFGGTVYNFPRQKIVMTHPFDLPIVGKKKFESNKVSKEELLSYWNEVRQKTGLKITENTQFKSLEPLNGGFRVTTSNGEHTAKKVVLSMGVRGSPRKLGIPGEDRSKVTYNLLDPEQYQERASVVVGGGNAAVEAAQMLAEARWMSQVHLLVRGEKFDRCNEENIQKITKMQNQGRLVIWFNSTLTEIGETEVTVRKGKEKIELPNHYVFVFAGAELPFKFLMGLGISIDKKFGKGGPAPAPQAGFRVSSVPSTSGAKVEKNRVS